MFGLPKRKVYYNVEKLAERDAMERFVDRFQTWR